MPHAYNNKSFRRILLLSLVFLACLSMPSIIYAQTDSTWEDMRLYGGQITAIAVDPQDNSTLYASSWLGDGLFKSNDFPYTFPRSKQIGFGNFFK